MPKPPRYAVLLTGAWGSGKTRFIVDYIGSAPKEVKYLYVSLYGASNASTIAERIFFARHPLLASKGAVVAGKAIKVLAGATLKITDDDLKDVGQVSLGLPDLSGTIQTVSPSTAGRVLVLDDVERANVPLPELWGFINRIVEQEGGKVILIANEGKLVEQDASHGETKEKNIGMTLHIHPDVSAAFDAVADEYGESPATKETLETSKLEILQLYEQSCCQNLRVLRLAILDFVRILDEMPDDIRRIPRAVSQIQGTALALGYEVHVGNLNSRDIPKLNAFFTSSLDTTLADFHGRDLGEPTDNSDRLRCKAIMDKYGTSSPFSWPCPSLEWWDDYFSRGIVGREELDAELRNRYLRETPSWLTLARFNTLTDAEFTGLLDSTWSTLVSGEYSALGEILHVAGVHLWAQSKGLSEIDPEDIYQTATHAIKQLDNEAILEGYAHIHWNQSYEGIVFVGADLDSFAALMSTVKDLLREASDTSRHLRASELLKALTTDVGSFSEILAGDMARGGSGNALLTLVDPSEFARCLWGLDPESQSWAVEVIRVKTPTSQNEHLHEWTTTVLETLQELANATGPSLRLLLLRRDLQRLMRGE